MSRRRRKREAEALAQGTETPTTELIAVPAEPEPEPPAPIAPREQEPEPPTTAAEPAPELEPPASMGPEPEPDPLVEPEPPASMGPEPESAPVPQIEPEPVPVIESAQPIAPAPEDGLDAVAALVAMGPELEPVDFDELAPEVGAPPAADRRRGPRFNFFTGTLLLAAIALLGGYLAVNLILMPSLTRQGAEVRVPEVVGFSEREAERLLAAEDLKLSKISEQWSPDVPRGFITAQDPAAGGVVKRGRRISVIVSLGAQGTSVPILEGVTARQAEILLEGAGLKAGRTARAHSDQVGRDLIIASDPPGETMVEQETSVDLLVSLGPSPRSFVLPNLAGRDAASAARSLRDAGFSVTLREGGPRQRSGLVAAQEPASGRRVAPRDTIVLYYHP